MKKNCMKNFVQFAIRTVEKSNINALQNKVEFEVEKRPAQWMNIYTCLRVAIIANT